MPSLNKIQIIGHVGRDPETFGDQNSVTKFSVAVSDKWTSKQGEKKEQTEWFNIACFGKLGEIAQKYTKKGNLVYVEGKMQTREYTNKEGAKVKSTDLLANTVLNLNSKKTQTETNETTNGDDIF